jgi:23S rRNA (uridine2552-2'-O)-methyltransferase
VRNKLAGKSGGGIHGTIIGLDMLPMDPIADVHFIQGDFREEDSVRQLEEVLAGRKADVVLSDMAPNLSGIAITDAARVEYHNRIGNRIFESPFETEWRAPGQMFQWHGIQ